MKATLLAGALGLTVAVVANAAPVTYKIDPDHTYPSFAADHMGGLSVLRGTFKSTSGSITLDKAAKTGTVDITIDTTSLAFTNDKLSEHAKKEPKMFDVANYPTATYKGKISKWSGDTPTEVTGSLTLKGVTKPVTLKINQFMCKPHPMRKGNEVCGADASGTINRYDF
ncbi:MAG TPA: YceI family protein, partial [Steroidobacteraceae bacterium]|nr:YceI family protein [Steroidobacteraceae bacterium]